MRGDDAAVDAKADVSKAGRGPRGGPRADVRRTEWGRARRGDDALAPRLPKADEQAERVRMDCADAHRSAWGQHRVAMMRLLLDAGADVDKQDEDGATALMQMRTFLGSEHGLVYIAPMMRLLVASGARIPLVSKLHADPPELAGYILPGAQVDSTPPC